MAKIRVYELAKELGMDNQALLEVLEKKQIEVKSHMSSLEESVVADLKKELVRKDSALKTEVKKETVKAETPEEPEKKEETAPKKKTIVQVFRPQNAKNSGRGNGRQGQRTPVQGVKQGQRPPSALPPRQAVNAQAQSAKGQKPQTAAVPVQAQEKPAAMPKAEKLQDTAVHQTETKLQRPSNTQKAVQEQQPRGNTRPQGDSQARRTSDGEREKRPQGDGQGRRFSDGERSSRLQRENRDNRDNRDSRENRDSRDNRNDRGNGRGNQGRRFSDGERSSRLQRENRDSRDNRDNRDNRDSRDNRNDRGNGRPQGRQGGRREDRSSIPAPMVEQQKSQRNKGKDKEKDYKKKELREGEFENKGKKGKKQKQVAEIKKPEPKQEKVEEIKQIIIPEVLTIKELADKMKIVPSVIVKKLFMQGKIVTVNQEIDFETAEEIAMEFEILCEKEEVVDVIEELLKEEEEDESTMEKRPPVVCVMGHVDHGKTSLLDAIRDSRVTDREAGGITQHIGASVVEVNGETITFLDTPGHEAFTAMRMRGANSTDIAILVVAADDGVMPQTVEAINHAKAAGIEIIVAINKIDKPSANVERVKQELTEYELIPEDWGGSTIFVPVSAHTKEGIQELLEMVLLTAEVMELKANANRAARGLVIEAQLDKGKGSVATVLVQKGTLHVGDAIAAGSAHGRVRAMMDDRGRRVKEAGPSQPVEILGLNDVPNAGEVFVSCDSEKEARNFAETFIAQNKVKLLDETKSKMSLDDLFTQIQEGNLKELNIVVKADVQGSVEALKQSLLKLSNDEVVIKIIHGGVGAINESDVILASASNAIIIGFNVRPDVTAKDIAEREGVDLRLYRVIYNAIEDVEAAMKGMLDPVFEEKILGHAEVRQTFKASGVGTIAGAYVQDGIFERNCSVRLTRDEIVIFEGPLASLKRFKDDVKEVRAGYECGFVFENYNDIKEGDLVEAYKMVEVERK